MSVKQNNALLLPRLLSLKDVSPFILIVDSLAQSGTYLVNEFLAKVPAQANVIFLSFEVISFGPRVNHSIDCHRKPLPKIFAELDSLISNQTHNLAYIPTEQLSQFLVSLMRPKCSVLATFHAENDNVSSSQITQYYPTALSLLLYFATTTIKVVSNQPQDNDTNDVMRLFDKFIIPTSYNKPLFQAIVVHRRRSGRGIMARFKVDSIGHSVEYIPPKLTSSGDEEDLSVLQDLTTFNLGTTDRQRKAKENVELPFMGAQEYGEGGVRGGAIIYEYEKDDDYDEEDPYEDPF